MNTLLNLNNINNNKLIKFNNSYEFGFLDNDNNFFKFEHPVSDYYFKISDLSINLLISLKWGIWGYIFLKEISTGIKNYDSYLILKKSIQKDIFFKEKKKKHELTIDDILINSENDFIRIMETIYDSDIFNENSKIHLKLKVNLKEYMILTNLIHPTFLK